MPLTPFDMVWVWLRGLLAIAILAGGAYALRSWYEDCRVEVVDRPAVVERVDPARPGEPAVVEPPTTHRAWRFDPGWNRATAELAAAITLLGFGLFGRPVTLGIYRATLKAGDDDPIGSRGGEVRRLRRPDGSELHVEIYGPADAPPIVMTHGWGADSTEWAYEKERLAGHFRLITWDLPGLGLSKKPDNNDYSLEKLAADLGAVLALAGGRPAVLLGHSIGGMITLTFARLFPEALGPRVAGLVLVHTTYKNPVRTMSGAAIKSALEVPVLVPLLRLTIWLWPLAWLMNWINYLNGSFHRQTHSGSFKGTETRGQLDFAAAFLPRARPDVLARGMFGMLAYDATESLSSIPIPTLVIAGDGDVTCLPSASEFIASHVPGATLETLAPARHMGLIERNERFDAVVSSFCARCLSGPSDRPAIHVPGSATAITPPRPKKGRGSAKRGPRRHGH